MRWDIINILKPKCNFCDNTTEQMARFYNTHSPSISIYICSSCGRFVKECMNKWPDLLEPGYVMDPTFKSDYIDTDLDGTKTKGGQHVPKDNHKPPGARIL